MKVKYYQKPDGTIPLKKWIKKNIAAAGKLLAAEARLSEGNMSSVKWLSGCPGIGEYKINWGAGLRIYLMQDGEELIILLCAGFKGSQQKDIEQAEKFRAEYLTFKRGN